MQGTGWEPLERFGTFPTFGNGNGRLVFREWEQEPGIPGNGREREFPLTPALKRAGGLGTGWDPLERFGQRIKRRQMPPPTVFCIILHIIFFIIFFTIFFIIFFIIFFVIFCIIFCTKLNISYCL